MLVHKFAEPVAILAGARTPIGRFGGPLQRFSAVELGGAAMRTALAGSGAEAAWVRLAVLGNVVGAGLGQAPAKQAALLGGLPADCVAQTTGAVCGSGAAAVVAAAQAIALGSTALAVAGGMESTSGAPYLLGPLHRDGQRIDCAIAAYRVSRIEGDLEAKIARREIIAKEATRFDGLFWDPERKFMAQYAVDYARRRGWGPEQVNPWAAESHRRARLAWAEGAFAAEVAALDDVAEDQLLSPAEGEAILAAEPHSVVNAYNTSVPADGAAALVLAAANHVQAAGLRPLGWLLGYAALACSPADFLEAPVQAGRQLLQAIQAPGDPPVTIVEANEAFAVQLPLFTDGFPGAHVNVHGGAVALGHPLGASGARLLVTLLHAMQRHGHRRGLEAICYGSGGAYALLVAAG